MYWVLRTECWILDIEYRILSTGYWVLDTEYRSLSTEYWVPNTRYRLLSTEYGILIVIHSPILHPDFCWMIYIFTIPCHVTPRSTIHFNGCVRCLEIRVRPHGSISAHSSHITISYKAWYAVKLNEPMN